MPYIKQERRDIISTPETPGELNFMVTELITTYLVHHGLCYTNCNDVMGALEGAKLEFYRRVVAPLEDIKMEENGDVYGDLFE